MNIIELEKKIREENSDFDLNKVFENIKKEAAASLDTLDVKITSKKS